MLRDLWQVHGSDLADVYAMIHFAGSAMGGLLRS